MEEQRTLISVNTRHTNNKIDGKNEAQSVKN